MSERNIYENKHGQVAVVYQHDAKGRIDVERLGLFFAERVAGRGVTHLAQTAIARKRTHIPRAKHIAHHALGLVHEEFALLLGHDPRCVLTTMLQQQQGVIYQLVDRCVTDNADYSTHG